MVSARKAGHGGALLVENVTHRPADVDEEAEGEGEIGVEVEVTDGLGMVVDSENEVGFGEGLDEGAFFVADDDRDVDEAGVHGEGGSGGRGLLGLGVGGLQYRPLGRRSLLGGKQGGRKQEERGQQNGPQAGLDGQASG